MDSTLEQESTGLFLELEGDSWFRETLRHGNPFLCSAISILQLDSSVAFFLSHDKIFSLILPPILNAACVWFGFSRPELASWPFSYMVHHELMHSYRVSQFSCCFGLCVCVPWNVCVDVPSLNVMVFGGGAWQTFLVLLCFTLGQTLCFCKLKVRGNPVSTKSISASFPIAFSHFISVCRILVNLTVFQRGFPRWHSGRKSPCQCRRCRFDPWVGKIPWRRKWQSIPVFFSWKIPWTEEPGGLWSVGSQRARHDWACSPTQCFKHCHDRYAWYDHLQSVIFDVTTMTHWSLRHWLVFFSNKVFVNYVRCFLKDILHTW